MNPHFTLLGLTFYWYGLIVGTAIAAVLVIIDFKAAQFDKLDYAEKKHLVSSRKLSLQEFFQHWSVVLLIGGFIGARLWHVATDWQLYRWRWLDAFSLSEGGLSILGAIVGGLLSLVVLRRLVKKAGRLPIFLVLDTLVFGIPFGQAIGRLGNWVNQELYGLPSSLPWSISIDPAFRLSAYEAVERYHPLFLYEMLAMSILGGLFWLIQSKRRNVYGTGFFTLLYFTVYSGVRFALDFLRLDRPEIVLKMGVNQIVLLLTFVACIGVWLWSIRNGYFSKPTVAAGRKR